MKRNSIFASGLALGLIIAMTLQVFAAPVLQRIEAYVNPAITFQFDGVKKDLPSEYKVLIYQDRTYVPTRFVAESLGAKVEWNADAQQILITKPKQEINPGDTVVTDSAVYTKLPLYTANANFTLAAMGLLKDETGYKLVCALENKTETPIQLDQLATKITVDGKDYSMSNVAMKDLDSRWYADVAKDKKTEGYIRLPNGIENPEKIRIEIKIRPNVYPAKESQTIVFNISVK